MRKIIFFVCTLLFLKAEDTYNTDTQEEQTQEKQSKMIIDYDNAYKSGLFLQAGMGSVYNYANYSAECETCGHYKAIEINSSINAGLGYQLFFNAYNGLRISSITSYSDFKTPKYNNNKPFFIATTNLAMDYILEFSQSKMPFGIFIGGGYEWSYGKFITDLRNNFPYNKKLLKTNGFFIHLGIAQTFAYRHRLELEYSFPFYSFYSASGNGRDIVSGQEAFIKADFRNFGNLKLNYIYVFGKKYAH